MAQETPVRSEMIAEFEADRDVAFRGGRMNNVTDIILSTLSVFASLAATVLVATRCPIALSASMAAVPAACTSLQRIVNFRARSHWYFEHASQLTALAIALRYANSPNLEDFAEKRASLEIASEKHWSQLGSDRAAATAPEKRKT
jgi:hypothetical protein